jgi:MFS family permease
VAEAGPAARPDMRILGVYLFGVFIGALDTNVLGPVLPLLVRGFHTTLTWTAWTVTAYTVSYVASTVLAGPAGDRVGRRRLLMAGLAAFACASALAALSHVLWLFLLARAVQGAGAGAVYPNAQAEGVRLFPAHRRGAALGMFGAVFGLASVIGPNVGGALGQYVGWPAIFAVNVPLALIALAWTRRLPESATAARPEPDWVGGLAFAAALTAALLALAVDGAASPFLLALAAALAVLFALRQRRAASPFLDTRPLLRGGGVPLVVGAALIGYDLSAAVFVPTLAQRELGLSILGSGFALMPAALSGAVLAAVGGVLVDRVGPRGVVQAGLGAAVVGGVLLALPHLGLGLFVVAMLAFGVATAFTVGAPPNRMALALYRDEQAGEALALVAVFRSVGLAAGPVLLTAAANWRQFSGMFGSVALAAALAIACFALLPNLRPTAPPRSA